MVLKVDSKHHLKIVGKQSANISKIHSDFDVQVQFPDKSDIYNRLDIPVDHLCMWVYYVLVLVVFCIKL